MFDIFTEFLEYVFAFPCLGLGALILTIILCIISLIAVGINIF